MQKRDKVVFEEKDEIIRRLKDFTLSLTSLNESKVFKPPLEGFLVQQDVTKLVQEPSESTDVFAQKIHKGMQVRLKKTNFAKIAKHKLGFSPLKLKIHREASRHITIKEVDEEEEIQVEPPRVSVFNRLSTPSLELRSLVACPSQGIKIPYLITSNIMSLKFPQVSLFIQGLKTRSLENPRKGETKKASCQTSCKMSIT